jgi:hypothetical protein
VLRECYKGVSVPDARGEAPTQVESLVLTVTLFGDGRVSRVSKVGVFSRVINTTTVRLRQSD